MSCPYFEVGSFGTCGASASRYVPGIGQMETYCFKQIYRLCPTLSEYLYENDMAMANHSPIQVVSSVTIGLLIILVKLLNQQP